MLNTNIYDRVITVDEEDAFRVGRMIGQKEGVLVGISSGAAAHAAIELAKLPENEGKNIVVLYRIPEIDICSTPLIFLMKYRRRTVEMPLCDRRNET